MDTKRKTAMELAPHEDAIELLIADHHRVAKLFAEFDALKENGSGEAKLALVARICQELTVHTAIEEEIFYPAVRKAIEDVDLMDEALVEHAGAKTLIVQLQAADVDDELYDATVTVLGEQIDHHVEEEEGSMFPQARGAKIDTLSLGAAMLKRRAELLVNPPSSSPTTTAVNDENPTYPEALQPRRASAPTRRARRPVTKKKASKKTR